MLTEGIIVGWDSPAAGRNSLQGFVLLLKRCGLSALSALKIASSGESSGGH